MALPNHLRVVGIQSCELREDGSIVLRLALSDGSVCASWWGAADLQKFMSVVIPAPLHECAPSWTALQ